MDTMLLLLSRFSRIRLCATPQTAAHQAPRRWDSPGKNTGVGCHFLLQCMKVKSESEVAQSYPTPSDPMDCNQAPPSMGFSRQEYWSGLPLPSLNGHYRGHQNDALGSQRGRETIAISVLLQIEISIRFVPQTFLCMPCPPLPISKLTSPERSLETKAGKTSRSSPPFFVKPGSASSPLEPFLVLPLLEISQVCIFLSLPLSHYFQLKSFLSCQLIHLCPLQMTISSLVPPWISFFYLPSQ